VSAALRVLFYGGRCGRRSGIQPVTAPLEGFSTGDVEAAITKVAKGFLLSRAVDTACSEDDRGGGEFEVSVGYGRVVATGFWLVVHQPAPSGGGRG